MATAFDELAEGRDAHVDDDLDPLIARADEIRRDDLHVLRFRR